MKSDSHADRVLALISRIPKVVGTKVVPNGAYVKGRVSEIAKNHGCETRIPRKTVLGGKKIAPQPIDCFCFTRCLKALSSLFPLIHFRETLTNEY